MNSTVLDWCDPLWSNRLTHLAHDIYHLPEYLYCEAQRTQSNPDTTLITEGQKACLIPYLRRPCNLVPAASPKIYDIALPNGYSGFLLNPAALEDSAFGPNAWQKLLHLARKQGICSAFLRLHPSLDVVHPQGMKDILVEKVGQTVSINLELSESELWSHTHTSQRNKIN